METRIRHGFSSNRATDYRTDRPGSWESRLTQLAMIAYETNSVVRWDEADS